MLACNIPVLVGWHWLPGNETNYCCKFAKAVPIWIFLLIQKKKTLHKSITMKVSRLYAERLDQHGNSHAIMQIGQFIFLIWNTLFQGLDSDKTKNSYCALNWLVIKLKNGFYLVLRIDASNWPDKPVENFKSNIHHTKLPTWEKDWKFRWWLAINNADDRKVGFLGESDSERTSERQAVSGGCCSNFIIRGVQNQ